MSSQRPPRSHDDNSYDVDNVDYRSRNARSFDQIADGLSSEYSSSEEEIGSQDNSSDVSGESSGEESAPALFEDSETLQNQNVRLERQLAETMERLNQAKTELALEQSRRPTHYSDRYFVAELEALRGQIRDWTNTHFSHAGGHWTPLAEKRFKRLSGDWPAFMEDKCRRPWLIQAYIWNMLQERLFDSVSETRPSYLFTKRKQSIDRRLAQASQQSSITARTAFYEWRAATFMLLFPGIGEDIDPAPYIQEDLDARVQVLWKQVWNAMWNYSEHPFSMEERGVARKALQEIVRSAMYFELDMRKHTAEMYFPHSIKTGAGFEFDSKSMEEMINFKGEGRVKLVVSPPLCREVLSENEVVSEAMVKKAQVWSGHLERLPQSGFKKAVGTLYTTSPSRINPPARRGNRAYNNQQLRHLSTARRSSQDSRRSQLPLLQSSSTLGQ